MNQTCKVCGEPAAGFHFGAFTCEGCKSFFGRSYNNLSSISECKNNGECVINKKNRTACKACRLRKCLLVGMSKSGSRYGRRSNWFKIHCLLQEQQQQAAAHAAAVAARGSSGSEHHHHHHNHHNHHNGGGGNNNQKSTPPPPPTSALSMLGHPGVYPHGLYPARTKEDLMMLGLEEYANSKHPSASPSVSSPDSHNSDSSIDINVRSNSLLRLTRDSSGGHPHKDLFLPLPFPGLSSLPVMPPPAFLPPSHHHLLFPGYHPALYQHHQGLLKPASAAELHLHHQQQQHHAMMTSPGSLIANQNNNNNNNRFTPNHNNNNNNNSNNNDKNSVEHDSDNIIHHNNNNSINNNNHIVNGSKAAEELTKRFYLDAVLKSQRRSPSLIANPIPTLTTSSSAIITSSSINNNNNNNTNLINNTIITPNSEISRNSRCNDDSIKSDIDDDDEDIDADIDDSSNCGEDLIVSMTPPRSPILNVVNNNNIDNNNVVANINNCNSKRNKLTGQDNPIDLSMKTGSSDSNSSSRNSCKSSNGSIDDINRHLSGGDDCDNITNGSNGNHSNNRHNSDEDDDDDDDETTTTTTITTTIQKRNQQHQYTNGGIISGSDDETAEYERSIKRMKLQLITTPLDLTTRV